MKPERKEPWGYGRINIAKKSGKPYFSLSMKDEFGNNVYKNGYINNMTEAYINPISMGVFCYVEEVYRRGGFGSPASRKVEIVKYILNQDTGEVNRVIIDKADIPVDAIRTVMLAIKNGEDAKYPHITFFQDDNQNQEASPPAQEGPPANNDSGDEEQDPF